MGKGWRVLDWPCWQCLAQDEPRVNWHRMPWFGVVWNESYGFLRRGCWDCYLVTVILVVWFVYLKIILLHELVLRLIELEYDLTLHVVHVAGSTWMIAQGTDGLSREIFLEGVVRGEDMLSFVDLLRTAIERPISSSHG